MKSARADSERFCSQARFGKQRNTLCTRKGCAASVSQLALATAALYFLLFKPQHGGKRSAAQPQTISSEFPYHDSRKAGNMQLWEIIWAEISGRAHNVPTGTRRVICGWLTTSEFVGEDSIFPVVFPTEKQRRRNAPTMQYRTFCDEIRWHHVETWYIGNIGALVGVWRFCPEICYGGGRILSAPTQTVSLNYCRGDFGAFVGVVRAQRIKIQ